MTSFILCALLAVAAPVAHQPAPLSGQADNNLSDAEIRSTVRSYMGTIDVPIDQTRWQRLGPRAEGALLEIINSATELSPYRAKAIDGLSMIGTPNAQALLARIANDEQQPVNVRTAAVRGLARVTSDDQLLAVLKPILEKAQASRVRARAGELLAQRLPARACTVVRAQVSHEQAETQGQFAHALKACSSR